MLRAGAGDVSGGRFMSVTTGQPSKPVKFKPLFVMHSIKSSRDASSYSLSRKLGL